MLSHIAILGGGLVGRLTALQLADLGLRVSLFEQGSRVGERAAAYVAAAMLAPTAEALDATPEVIALGRQSMGLWPAIVQRLKASTQVEVMMQQSGSLIVWHGQDQPLAAEFARHLQRCQERGQEQGLVQEQVLRWGAAEIAQHEPQLAGRFAQGFYLPAEGQLEGRQILLALADALQAQGVACHWHSALEVADVRARCACDWLIDCRGYGAKAAWNRAHAEGDAGGSTGSADSAGSALRGVRGEVARVHAPEVTLHRPVRLLHPRYPLYIAPKPGHVFVVGATQIESESAAPASVRAGLELLSALYAVHPAFGEADILELASGLRPTLAHHNPQIRFSRAQRLVEINGLFRHGFMISPAVTAAAVRLVAALCKGDALPANDAPSGLPWRALD